MANQQRMKIVYSNQIPARAVDQEQQEKWNEIQSCVTRMMEKLDTGSATLGITWQTGDHGTHCHCHFCGFQFRKGDDIKGYNNLICDYLLSSNEKMPFFDHGKASTYVLQKPGPAEIVQRELESLVRSRMRMKAWIEKYPFFKMDQYYDSDSGRKLEVNRIILDNSGLFTDYATAEYYTEIDLMANPQKIKKVTMDSTPKPDGRHYFPMERTMVVNLKNVRLEGKDHVDFKNREMLKELLQVFGLYYAHRGNGLLPVYYIYSNTNNGYDSWKEWADTVISVIQQLGEKACHSHWIGLGYGIMDTLDPEAYREISETMANYSMRRCYQSTTAFNVFHSKTASGNTPQSRQAARMEIIRGLKEYLVSHDPKRLPAWVNPAYMEKEKKEQAPQAAKGSWEGKQTGYHVRACHKRTKTGELKGTQYHQY